MSFGPALSGAIVDKLDAILVELRAKEDRDP
jgi:hypothetical protein